MRPHCVHFTGKLLYSHAYATLPALSVGRSVSPKRLFWRSRAIQMSLLLPKCIFASSTAAPAHMLARGQLLDQLVDRHTLLKISVALGCVNMQKVFRSDGYHQGLLGH